MSVATCIDTLPDAIVRIAIINTLLLIVYMTLFWVLARTRKRLDTVDIAWGIGYSLIAWSAYVLHPKQRSLVIAVLVSIWGLRLAQHIYSRARFKGEDPRYTKMAEKWKGDVWVRAYFAIFLTQAVLIAIIGLPIATATGHKVVAGQWLTVLGSVVWLKGFIIEVFADRQLGKYIRLEKRPKVLKTGLWKYSRHPNYYGEIIQWWGIAIIALQASFGWVGLLGPLLLTILIVFVSGIPPIEKRRAKDAAYRDYQKQTSALIPLPPKKS